MTNKYILVNCDNERIKIKLDDIIYIKALSDYSEIYIDYLNNNINITKRIITLVGITKLKNHIILISPHNFIDIHRSYMINIDKLIKITDYDCTMVNDIEVPISENNKKELLKTLNYISH